MEFGRYHGSKGVYGRVAAGVMRVMRLRVFEVHFVGCFAMCGCELWFLLDYG